MKHKRRMPAGNGHSPTKLVPSTVVEYRPIRSIRPPCSCVCETIIAIVDAMSDPELDEWLDAMTPLECLEVEFSLRVAGITS